MTPLTASAARSARRASMRCFTLLAILLSSALVAAPATAQSANKRQLERGRYLVKIGGCNDCHTPEYAMKSGDVPETQWLVGDKLGWSGPWGTTYPANLRMLMAGMSERQWVKFARNLNARPPMPWYDLRAMSNADLRAIYAFTRSLGPAGEPAPSYVPPGTKPAGPVVQFPG